MSELAFTKMGQRFTPSEAAVWWGVHELLENRGVKTLYDRSGAPLRIPIAADSNDLRAAVDDRPGRFRLTQLDADLSPIADAARAYARLPQQRDEEEDDDAPAPAAPPAIGAPALRNAAAVATQPTTVTAPFGTWPALPMPVSMVGTEYLVGEALRGQMHMQMVQIERLTELVAATVTAHASVVNANSAGAAHMMNAAAELLRAADGAAMPRRDPPPAPPPPPAAPPPPFVGPMPRNSVFADDGYDDGEDDDDEDDEDDDDDIDAPSAPTEEDFFSKVSTLVTKVGEALAPVASVAQMVMGAGIGGMFSGGGGDAPRNAADSAPSIAPPELTTEENDGGHLRVSHVIAVSHELGAEDGALFRRGIRAMEPADRRMLVDRLCEMRLEEAARFAARQVARLKDRLAHACTDDLPPDDLEHGTDEDDDCCHEAVEQADALHPDQEHDPTQHHNPTPTTPHEREPEDELEDECPDEAATVAPPAPSSAAPDRSTMPIANPSAEAPLPVTPAITAHMKLICQHLKFTEILQAQGLINSTSIAERNGWITRLMALEPAQAATIVRAELARRAGG